jgi:hypothetical protein
MSIKRTLLALGVPAAIMLVGCRQPVGLPCKVHTASVVHATVDNDESWSGVVDRYNNQGSYSYDRKNPLIEWGFDSLLGNPGIQPNGFCIFRVPKVDDDTAVAPMACTLYYCIESYGGTHASLTVVRLHDSPLNESDEELWWDVFQGTSIAYDDAHQNTGWYKTPLSQPACQVISAIAQSGGGCLYTGWIWRGADALGEWLTTAYGAGDYSPYIVMAYP